MSIRRTQCPECHSNHIEILLVVDPGDRSINSKALLKCIDCGNIWEGRTLSAHVTELRDQGKVRV